jgi:phosphoglucomutase
VRTAQNLLPDLQAIIFDGLVKGPINVVVDLKQQFAVPSVQPNHRFWPTPSVSNFFSVHLNKSDDFLDAIIFANQENRPKKK